MGRAWAYLIVASALPTGIGVKKSMSWDRHVGTGDESNIASHKGCTFYLEHGVLPRKQVRERT